MIASLGFQLLIDRDKRPIPSLTLWLRPDDRDASGWMSIKLAEATGSEENVAKVIRQLLNDFLAKLPQQEYGSTMHIQTEITGSPCGSEFMQKVIGQFTYSTQKGRASQTELPLRFKKFKIRVVCFIYRQ